MPYYLAPYIGSGGADDPFRPRGSDDPTWAAIDLRPDVTRLDGGGLNACLLWVFTPSSDPALFHIADDEQETLRPAGRNALRSRLGLTTLAASRWDQIALEVLLTPPANAWKPVRASRVARRYEVWLGPGAPLITQPVIAGGATITENWNCADSATSPSCQNTWSEVQGAWGITSNQLSSLTDGSGGNLWTRCDADLATDDHYGQVVYVSATTLSNYGACCRFASAAETFYTYIWRAGVSHQLFRCVTGTLTQIGSNGTATRADGETLKCQADGSTITGHRNGTLDITATDTNITANVRGGVFGRDATTQLFDSFEAADLAAGGATWPGWMHSRGGWTA